ncbi:MAG: ABC transporter substrate-binding protein [Ilumatobacteraceae bacterium]
MKTKWSYSRKMAMSALAVVGFVTASCGSSSDSDASETVTSETVMSDVIAMNIAVDGFTLGTPVWVALENGYFAEEGLEVTPVSFESGFEAVQSLSAGQVDVAWALDFATVSSSSGKLAVLSVIASPATGFHKMTFGSGISSPADLEGKKIGVVEGTSQSYVTTLWVQANGLEGSVELVPLPQGFEIVTALKTGEIQAAFLWGTAAAEVTEDSGLTIVGDDSSLLKVQGIYALSTAEFASANTEAISRMLRAIQKANEAIAADPDAAAQLTATAVSGNPEALLPSIKNSNPGIGFSTALRDQLVAIEQFLKSAGKIPDTTDVIATLNLDALRLVAPDSVEF